MVEASAPRCQRQAHISNLKEKLLLLLLSSWSRGPDRVKRKGGGGVRRWSVHNLLSQPPFFNAPLLPCCRSGQAG